MRWRAEGEGGLGKAGENTPHVRPDWSLLGKGDPEPTSEKRICQFGVFTFSQNIHDNRKYYVLKLIARYHVSFFGLFEFARFDFFSSDRVSINMNTGHP